MPDFCFAKVGQAARTAANGPVTFTSKQSRHC